MSGDAALLDCEARFASAVALLADTPSASHGGSGRAFDWTMVPGPQERHMPLVLAGGLDEHNVGAAVRAVRPYAVDVSSGVEIGQRREERRQDRTIHRRGTCRGCRDVMKPYDLPDARGHFGPYGGTFVAETLMHALEELRDAYEHYRKDPEFIAEFERELKHFVGRPSPVYHARRWSEQLGGAQIFLKREDLNHTGAHKVNNTIGQALLAKRMGKPRVIAETGAGQHGVATATVAARFGMECVVYMGTEDVGRQAANVYRMKLLGATLVPVDSGSRTLKDALNEAMRDWVTNVENTFYIIGTVAGPHPYPMMVRDFNAVVGRECLRADAGAHRPAARLRRRLRRRRQQRDGHLLRLHRAREREARRRRGRRRGPDDDEARREPAARLAGRAARQPHVPAAERGRTDHGDAFRVRRPRLSRASAPSTRGSRTPAARSTSARPMPRRSRRSTTAAASKASFRRSSRAMRSPTRRSSPRPCRATASSS